MRKIALALFSSLILLIFFAIFKNQAYAEKRFSTDYSLTYNVAKNAKTNATIKITFTNKTSLYYISTYKIQLAFNDVSNIKVSDSQGKINPRIIKNNRGNELSVTFNENIVGKDKKQELNISFTTNEVARIDGNIFEIIVPGIDSKELDNLTATVIVPKDLGSPSYVKPNTYTKTGDGMFTFDKSDLGRSGINMAFGKEQIYKFNLFYHIDNTNIFSVKKSIALPPPTSYQDVYIENINPKPQNVYIDDDGNWMAEFGLPPSKKENIEVTGYASVVANPKGSIVSNELLKKYLKNERYWESESPKIKDLALKLKTPSEIYDYVVNNLTYDYDRVTKDQSRAGAESVLTDPTSAVCLEFTDLFIALSRSAGIPARELNGYGYTRDENYRPLSKVSDVLHSWPQYYDLGKQSWVMVDPTWGNTTGGIDYYHTFDFNHLTLAIHGVKSNYPVPAGGYKLSAKDETLKDVIVTPVKVITLKKSNATKISFKFPSKINSGISSKGEIIVENTGNYASDPQSILLETENLSPKRSQFRIGRIPPFGKNTIPIVVSSSNFLTKGEDNIKITSQSQTFIQNVEVILFFFNIYFIIGGTLVVIAIIIISIIAYKSRSIYLPQQ